MSKQSAEKFLAEATRDAGLKRKLLAAAATVNAWLGEAATAGYAMTVDELRAAAEALVGKPLGVDGLVGALRGLVEGEIGDDSLDAVTGGTGIQPAPAPARALQVNTVKGALGPNMGSDGSFDKESGPIKVGIPDRGGTQQRGGG